MSISYPLTPPSTPGNRSVEWIDQGNVGIAISPFTGEQQVTRWPNQSWGVKVTLPAMDDASAGAWIALFLSLNGPEGTFYLGDSVRKVPRGTIAGTVTVDTGAAANATTLPITGGTGAFAVGDWLQIDTAANSRLHRVIKVNAGSVDVFPRLRASHTAGTAITYNNPKGVFRLAARVAAMFDEVKVAHGITFQAMEAL